MVLQEVRKIATAAAANSKVDFMEIFYSYFKSLQAHIVRIS